MNLPGRPTPSGSGGAPTPAPTPDPEAPPSPPDSALPLATPSPPFGTRPEAADAQESGPVPHPEAIAGSDPPPLRIDLLAIGPHPDDVELTSSGLLLRAKRLGWRTGAIELTRGEMGTRGTVEKRQRELDRATEILQLDYRHTLGLPDGGVRPTPEAIELLVRQLRMLDPRVIILPPPEDDEHPDHWHASQLGLEAVHFAQKIKYLPALPPMSRFGSIMYAIYRKPLEPHVVVDVTDVMTEAEQAVAVFDTQYGRDPDDQGAPETIISNSNFLEWWRARRSRHGMLIGTRFGEGYRLRGPLRLDDPVAHLSKR